jgi:hypothetical protein
MLRLIGKCYRLVVEQIFGPLFFKVQVSFRVQHIKFYQHSHRLESPDSIVSLDTNKRLLHLPAGDFRVPSFDIKVCFGYRPV